MLLCAQLCIYCTRARFLSFHEVLLYKYVCVCLLSRACVSVLFWLSEQLQCSSGGRERGVQVIRKTCINAHTHIHSHKQWKRKCYTLYTHTNTHLDIYRVWLIPWTLSIKRMHTNRYPINVWDPVINVIYTKCVVFAVAPSLLPFFGFERLSSLPLPLLLLQSIDASWIHCAFSLLNPKCMCSICVWCARWWEKICTHHNNDAIVQEFWP